MSQHWQLHPTTPDDTNSQELAEAAAEPGLGWISGDAVQDEKPGSVYQARAAVNDPPTGSSIQAAPGLQATAEIKTDERRVSEAARGR